MRCRACGVCVQSVKCAVHEATTLRVHCVPSVENHLHPRSLERAYDKEQRCWRLANVTDLTLSPQQKLTKSHRHSVGTTLVAAIYSYLASFQVSS